MGVFINLTGQRFGSLVVGDRLVSSSKSTMWEVVCDCGVSRAVSSGNLRNGHTQSCGHLRYERIAATRKQGGLTVTKRYEYSTYSSMLQRCNNKSVREYRWYGGRGIKVCSRWSGSGGFGRFLEDMGDRPYGLTLDRIDGDKGYSKENCRWATWQEQAANKKTNHMVDYYGESITITEAARRMSTHTATIYRRLRRGDDIYVRKQVI